MPAVSLFWVLPTALGACAPFAGRAAAPDQVGESVVAADHVSVPAMGPAVLVHVESVHDATLVRLGENHEVVERCSAPCDRSVPLDATYRIDGPEIRSSWPFHLEGAPGDRVALSVSPSLRSSYATGNTVSGAGLVAAGVGMAAALVGGLAGTSAADANGGAPAPCPACTVSVVGGGALLIAGVVVATTGLVMSLSNMSSGTSQRHEVPAATPMDPSLREGTWRLPNATETAWPAATHGPVLQLRF